jgi:hypothetical protein
MLSTPSRKIVFSGVSKYRRLHFLVHSLCIQYNNTVYLRGGTRTATCLTHIFKTISLTNIHQRNTLRNFGCVHANEIVSSSYTVKKDVLMGMWVSISWLPSARQHPVLVGIPIIPPPPPQLRLIHITGCAHCSAKQRKGCGSPPPPRLTEQVEGGSLRLELHGPHL